MALMLEGLYDKFLETNIIGRKLLSMEYYKASERANLARIPKAYMRQPQKLIQPVIKTNAVDGPAKAYDETLISSYQQL